MTGRKMILIGLANPGLGAVLLVKAVRNYLSYLRYELTERPR